MERRNTQWGLPLVLMALTFASTFYVGAGMVLGRLPTSLTELGTGCLMGMAADVARWDQRGCRSPHALVVRGDLATASRIATLLANEPYRRSLKAGRAVG